MESGNLTKILIAGIFLAFIVFLGVQIWKFEGRVSEAEKSYEAAAAARDERKAEEISLEADMKYLSNPENFLKELRSRFNYHSPGERTLILVPSSTSSD